ncbi:hypothetical protein [Paenibacillus oryzisoli]|uniref:hypothetical protein n=1 Tax=Paenibacillus oryzisoli TaxID=1850517 RepID=UPI0012F88259|nr:hypothetical protein [Paenibacillus oryzisoli]
MLKLAAGNPVKRIFVAESSNLAVLFPSIRAVMYTSDANGGGVDGEDVQCWRGQYASASEQPPHLVDSVPSLPDCSPIGISPCTIVLTYETLKASLLL